MRRTVRWLVGAGILGLLGLACAPAAGTPAKPAAAPPAAAATAAGLVNAVALDVPLRIVADKGSTPPGFGYQAVVVRKDLVDGGVFRGCSSFKGLRVANPAVENSAGPMYARMLRECGLDFSDIDMITMGFPDMPAAFRNGAID